MHTTDYPLQGVSQNVALGMAIDTSWESVSTIHPEWLQSNSNFGWQLYSIITILATTQYTAAHQNNAVKGVTKRN